ncbi:hypothetical protein LTR17_020762 [Elasticomyces elasticus]|nr:hypothetical protein LTR17_020762 [Elasticomyces elasticus]
MTVKERHACDDHFERTKRESLFGRTLQAYCRITKITVARGQEGEVIPAQKKQRRTTQQGEIEQMACQLEDKQLNGKESTRQSSKEEQIEAQEKFYQVLLQGRN